MDIAREQVAQKVEGRGQDEIEALVANAIRSRVRDKKPTSLRQLGRIIDKAIDVEARQRVM